MKIKYNRLSKENKIKYKKEYYQTNEGKYVKRKLLSALVCGILCLIISIYLLIDAYISHLGIWQYIYGSCVFVFGIMFIIFYFKILITKLNIYVIKNKK